MEDIEPILDHEPAAVEVMDDILLDLEQETAEFQDVVGLLPPRADSVLLVEFYADTEENGKQAVANLIADRVPIGESEANPTEDRIETAKERCATGAMEAHDPRHAIRSGRCVNPVSLSSARLCIGCKGCARDCLSEVDMAKLKAEITHEYYKRHGISIRDRLFANINTLSKLRSTFAPISNLTTTIPGVRTVLELTHGIAAERELPTFYRQSFRNWFDDRDGAHITKQ